MLQFQNFVQDVMMLVTNLMKYKLRLPSIFKKTIHSMVASTVNDIFNKNDFKDASVIKTVIDVREYNKKLGFSEKWVTDFTFCVVMLAKKEKPAEDQTAKNK